MVTRFKNGLAVLMAVFVFVTASQSVVCEVDCASSAVKVCCKAAEVVAATPNAADAMNMAGGLCVEAKVGVVAHQAQGAGACVHSLDLAVERTAAVGGVNTDVRWVVVAVLPVQMAVPGGPWFTSQSPPVRVAWIDPLVVSLRV